MVRRLEQTAVLHFLLGWSSDAGSDVFDSLSVDRRLERHTVRPTSVSMRCCWQFRGGLNMAKRKGIYREMARIMNDDGGLICPMFNDFIDAHGPDTLGWVNDPNGEMMGGYAGVKCWLA